MMPKGDMLHYKYTGCGSMDLTSVCQLPGLKELLKCTIFRMSKHGSKV